MAEDQVNNKDLDEKIDENQQNLGVNKLLRDEKGRLLPGQPSLNPNGRPQGSSLKVYFKNKLAKMTDEEKEEFLKKVNPEVAWKMAEGNPKEELAVEEKTNPYDNLTDEQKRDNLRRLLTIRGKGAGEGEPIVPDGADTTLSKDGEDPQGSGVVSETSGGEQREESSNTSSEVTPEDNRDNDIIHNPENPEKS